jgi:hypothetical protein
MTSLRPSWQSFADNSWNQKPTVLRDREFITGHEIFDRFKGACERFRSGEIDEHAKMYINGKRLAGQDLAAALPRPEEATPEAFQQRLRQGHDAESFLVYGYDIQQYWPELTERVESFVGDLFEHVQRPGGPAAVEIFMGRYSSTDGGIHKERCATFHGVLAGRKTIRVWLEETWDAQREDVLLKHDETTGHDEVFLTKLPPDSRPDRSTDLVGQPGDILYWPAGWWHIGISPELTFSVTLAFYHAS